MAIRLRMSMHGRAHQKIYHIVAVHSKLRRDAKPAELLGIYDPHSGDETNPRIVRWSVDRLRYWLSVGAVPSKPVAKLLQIGHVLKPGSRYDPHAALTPKHRVQHPKSEQVPSKKAKDTTEEKKSS